MNVRNLRLKTCVSAVLAVAATSQSASAQENSTLLEEIVVTAQKRTESLQDVSIAISAFTDKTRDLIGLSTSTEMINFTPGATLAVAADRVTVRGIGRNSNSQAVDPGVANYVDGFYLSTTLLANTSQLFIDRVEVLRGPQGTLYGRNSIGGAVNTVAKRPTAEFAGEARALGGNYNRVDLEARIAGPITDWLRFSLGGGNYEQQDPYAENLGGAGEFGVKHDTYVEAQLAANFGDAVDVWAKVDSTSYDRYYGGAVFMSEAPYYAGTSTSPFFGTPTINGAVIPLFPNPLYNAGLGAATPQYTTPNPHATDPRAVNHNTPEVETAKNNVKAVLEVIGHLGFADLKYIGGFMQYEFQDTWDADNSSRPSYAYTPVGGSTPVTIDSTLIYTYGDNKKYFSNELNLISNSDGAVQWLAGLYQYDETYSLPNRLYANNQNQLLTPVTLTGAPAAANPGRNYVYSDMDMEGKAAAVFGQIDWKFADEWKTTVGVRYTKDKKEGDEFRRVVLFDPSFAANPFSATSVDVTTVSAALPAGTYTVLADGRVTRHLQGEWSSTSGTAGLEWTPQAHSLAYLKYTRGYKAGGIDAGTLSKQPYTEPEHIDAIELGWKQDIGSRLQANISTFYYDYQGSQIPLTVPTLAGNVSQIYNIDQTLYGAEIETVWRPIDSLQVMLNYAYLHTKIDDPTSCYSDVANTATNVGPQPCVTLAGTAGQKIDGNEVARSPQNKASLNLLYTLDFTPGSLALSGSYFWLDEQYSSVFTRRDYLMPSFGQADFRATWTNTGNDYSVVAYLKNAFDTLGYDDVAASNDGSGAIRKTYSYTLPRTFGMQLQYRFGARK